MTTGDGAEFRGEEKRRMEKGPSLLAEKKVKLGLTMEFVQWMLS